jgi:hypothetical protein
MLPAMTWWDSGAVPDDRDLLLRAVRGVRADIVIHAATALARPPARHRDSEASTRKIPVDHGVNYGLNGVSCD